MDRFDKIFTFRYKKGTHMLFRVMNYDESTNELKFTLIDKRFKKKLTYSKDPFRLTRDDIITDYGEITYHSDGSVLLKYPRYPIPESRYINPKTTGFRRRKISEINDLEPVFKYDVFNYKTCKVDKSFIQEKRNIIESISNKIIFNGEPFSCIVSLMHKDYLLPKIYDPTEEILRVSGITKNLHLCVITAKINKKGNYINIDGSGKKIFSKENVAQIIEIDS